MQACSIRRGMAKRPRQAWFALPITARCCRTIPAVFMRWGREWAESNALCCSGTCARGIKALRWCRDEKNRDEAIRLVAEAEQIEEKAAASQLRQSPRDGQLNLPGLQSVLDLLMQMAHLPLRWGKI